MVDVAVTLLAFRFQKHRALANTKRHSSVNRYVWDVVGMAPADRYIKSAGTLAARLQARCNFRNFRRHRGELTLHSKRFPCHLKATRRLGERRSRTRDKEAKDDWSRDCQASHSDRPTLNP